MNYPDESLDPRRYHPNAVAMLDLRMGATNSGLTEILATYGYQRDTTDKHLFKFGPADDGLLFNDDYTTVVVVGLSEENMENVNYVLSNSGWSEVGLFTVSMEAESKILAAMNILSVVTTERFWGLATDGELEVHDGADEPTKDIPTELPPAPQKAEPSRSAPVAPALPAVQTPRATSHRPSENIEPLLKIFEDQVLPSLLPDASNPVIKALYDAGYEVSFSIRRR